MTHCSEIVTAVFLARLRTLLFAADITADNDRGGMTGLEMEYFQFAWLKDLELRRFVYVYHL